MTHTVDANGREHEVTLPEECQALMRHYPGWLVEDVNGRPRGTRNDASGTVVLHAPAIGLMGYVIAEYLHGEECAARRMGGVA